MRTRRREPEMELSDWQKAGWSEAPRNGREWKCLREGKPQPARKEAVKKCRVCGSTDRNMHYDHRRKKWGTRCVPCRRRRDRERYAKNKEREALRAAKYREKLRTEGPEQLPDGTLCIPSSVLTRAPRTICDLVDNGDTVLVNVNDVPSYYLLSIEEYRRLKARR